MPPDLYKSGFGKNFMAFSQQKMREIVFQLLYSWDFAYGAEADMTDMIMRQLAVTKKVVRNAMEQVQLIRERRDEIDQLISGMSKSYDFPRIPRIERNVLRLGVFELFFTDGIPPKVAISEAIRLCRKFATPEAASFINAILDALYTEGVAKRDEEEHNDLSLSH